MIRVGRTHAFALAWTLALALAPAPALAQLPSLGDAYELTPSAERRIGERIARETGAPVAIDSSIVGWPWVERTFSWVAPTAQALLALADLGQ